MTPISPQTAQELIAARLAVLPPEPLNLPQCVGRTLRQDVFAERDNPPFDRVCMDGIAIDSRSWLQGQRSYRIEAVLPAGAPGIALSSADHAVEVMTGAVLPEGTDCVIPLEEYDHAAGVIRLKDEAKAQSFRNVQRRGADSQPGVPMLVAGTRLGAAEVAVVASAGLAQVLVSRQPRVMIVSTGDELIEPGQPILSHQVRRSNAHAVAAALRDHGFRDVGDDHIPDKDDLLHERLSRHLAEREVLILSGGISKGKFDLVPSALRGLGVEEVFHRVAQRPGLPMWFGMGPNGTAVFGLPGNPVATMMCLSRYVIPALTAATGAAYPAPEPICLGEAVERGRPMDSFVPVVLRTDSQGRRVALPRWPNGSGDFLALAGTSGFIQLPPRAEAYPEGFLADLYRW